VPLAKRVSRYETSIFEIQLPARHGRRPLQGLMATLSLRRDAIMGFEDAINGLARGQRDLEELQGGITL